VLSLRRQAGGRGHGECHGDLDTANEEGRRVMVPNGPKTFGSAGTETRQ
jgi:hypothetical protein